MISGLVHINKCCIDLPSSFQVCDSTDDGVCLYLTIKSYSSGL